MCITASIGVLINIILAIILGGHHHGIIDEETNDTNNRKTNINLRAAILHVIGDLLASIGVLISSIILIFKPNYTIVDPICTFVFSVIVLYTTLRLVRDSLAVLMEGVPSHIESEAIEKALTQLPGVINVHDLHIWALSPGNNSLTAHITVVSDCNYHSTLYNSQKIIVSNFGIKHSTLQIEYDHLNNLNKNSCTALV